MNKPLFILGLILNMSSAGLSYYPVFQDFNETDYTIPFQKNEDFPNQRDLFIMNVYSDCNMSDSVFSQFSMHNTPICDTAQKWLYSLLFVMFIGITMMMIGAAYNSKIKHLKNYD